MLDAPTSLVGLFSERHGEVEGEPDGYAPAADAVLDPVEPGNGAVVVFARETNRWDSGACFAGDVDNGSDADVVWSGDIAVEGPVDNHWNSVIEDLGTGRVRFTGEAWNASLPPGSHDDVFGFCVAF